MVNLQVKGGDILCARISTVLRRGRTRSTMEAKEAEQSQTPKSPVGSSYGFSSPWISLPHWWGGDISPRFPCHKSVTCSRTSNKVTPREPKEPLQPGQIQALREQRACGPFDRQADGTAKKLPHLPPTRLGVPSCACLQTTAPDRPLGGDILVFLWLPPPRN